MFDRFRKHNETETSAGGGVAVAEREPGRDIVDEPAGEPTAVAPAAPAPARAPDGDGAAEREPVTRRRTAAPIVEHEELREMQARQRARFGGVSWGAAFFGWLCAVGLGAILCALLVAAGVAIGWSEIKGPVNGNTHTIGLGGGILLVIVLAISWYCGGYVAGRMSRFDGARQGLAVFVWTVLAVLVIAVLAEIGGSKYDVFDQLNLPRVPTQGNSFTTGGWIALGAAVVVTLVASILGGKLGESFHRRVDLIAASDWDDGGVATTRRRAVRA